MAVPNAWYRAEMARVRADLAGRVGRSFVHLNLADLDGSWSGYANLAGDTVAASSRLSQLTSLDYFRAWLYDEVGQTLAEQYLEMSVRVDLDDVRRMLRLKGPIEIKRLIGAGWDPVEAWRSALLQTLNVSKGYAHQRGMTALTEVMAGHTQYLQGWRRIVSPSACSFCRLLTRTVWQPSARWEKPHDGCGCTAEPVPNQVRVRRILSPFEVARNEAMRANIARRKDRERAELAALAA